MGRTHAERESLQRAARRLCPVAAGSVTVGPATAADIEAPETGRNALHGHG
ncbi:hypothetical protein [Streptomyces sp. NPDC050704]|uniref:hypothetical protein n=1 Tax=Streptomyces sp. NPDC050704 TaxID=3157219 RepID=UPI0034159170